MGELIRFRPRQGARRRDGLTEDAAGGGARSADILLFTGVRYERQAGETGTKTRPRGRPKKRA